MVIRTILWDFGDTLADERWMMRPFPGLPQWPQIYREFSERGALVDMWNKGLASLSDVAGDLGRKMDVPAVRVRAHMEECSRNIRFFLRVGEIVRRRVTPQAIVTVNPDVFSNVVVPFYALRHQFDVIVTSWEEGTLDKAELCEIALSRLGGLHAREECLLIDNKEDCIALWRKRGGRAYHFSDEGIFCSQFEQLIG
jgi:hypothetical protein